MSLVTAAISNSPPSLRHSSATSAVFPEPTGPPTPNRNALMWDLLSRYVQSHPLTLVQHGAHVYGGREGVHPFRDYFSALLGYPYDLFLEVEEHPLGGAPSERDELLTGSDQGGSTRVEIREQDLFQIQPQNRGRNPVTDRQVTRRFASPHARDELVEPRILQPKRR